MAAELYGFSEVVEKIEDGVVEGAELGGCDAEGREDVDGVSERTEDEFSGDEKCPNGVAEVIEVACLLGCAYVEGEYDAERSDVGNDVGMGC